MAIAIIRTMIIFFSLVVSMRIMGKRQLGELEPAELVVAVLISDLASHPLQDPGIPLLYGLIPVITLLCCEVLISAGLVRSIRFRRLVCGRPSVIIDNGKIVQSEMKKNRFTVDELTEELRKKEILDIASVQYAILETDGTLSTILYAHQSPATPEQLGLTVKKAGYPVIVINDGRIMAENLHRMGRDKRWLQAELKKRGIKEASEVYIMTIDAAGKVYFSAKASDAKSERGEKT